MLKQNLPIVTAVLLVSSCITHEGSDSHGKSIDGKSFVDERVFTLDLFDRYGNSKGRRTEFVIRVAVKAGVARMPMATMEFKERQDGDDFELIENTTIEGDDEKFVIEGQDASGNTFYVTVEAEDGRWYLSALKIDKLSGDYYSEITAIELRRPAAHEMYPLGSQVFREYRHMYEHGTKKTVVHTHIRKVPEEIAMHFSENLQYLYWSSSKKYPKINKIRGFPAHHNIDSVIQFWLEYWRSQGVRFPPGLDPLHIKALIAVESSFNPKAKARTTSATGLMQVLEPVLELLEGVEVNNWQEVPNNHIKVSPQELENPIINIAVGIRWLGHKFYLLRKHSRKGVRETLRDYHSRTIYGRRYADKIIRLYSRSK